MLLDGAADHQPFERIAVHVAYRLTERQPVFAAGDFHLDQFLALGAANFADPAMGVQSAASGLLQIVAVLHRHGLALNTGAALHIQFDLRGNGPVLIFRRQQLHIRLVVTTLYVQRSDFDLLDQFAFVSIDRIESVKHVVFVGMGCGVAQGAERVHLAEGFPTMPFQAAINALRFVHNDNGLRGPDQVNGLLATRFLSVLVEIVHVLFVDGPDRDHHDLNVWTGGEVAYLAEFGGVVEEELERSIGVENAEMIFGDLEGFIDAFFNRDGGYDNDKFGETVVFMEFKDCA